MSQEKLNNVVTGILYDFIQFLTLRKDNTIMETQYEFLEKRRDVLDFLVEKNVIFATPTFQWIYKCDRINKVD